MIERLEVRADCYFDSIRLMQATAAMREVEGVSDALAVMASPAGRGFLADIGFALSADPGGIGADPAVTDAGAGDLVIAVRGCDQATCGAAIEAFDGALRALQAGSHRGAGDGQGMGLAPPPRTLSTAAQAAGLAHSAAAELGVALISVPGEHAYCEAMDALDAGLHVMLFSDNVSLEQECALKHEAARRERLVMGPDCGTAIISGVGLGFANAVEPGPVSVVGASGTGIQQLLCLLDEAGVGVRHALGTGGRDLSAEVGGVATFTALAALDRDPDTELIALVSKPPDQAVAARIETAADDAETPVIRAFLGTAARTLEDAAGDILRALGREPLTPSALVATTSPRARGLVGLFAGGSLCAEARALAAAALGPVATDEPMSAEPPADDAGAGSAAAAGSAALPLAMIDYGDDRFTRGRGHPMFDQRYRLERFEAAVSDPRIGVILLDVMLGYGAHPDPASELAPCIARAVAAGVAVVTVLCGTRKDPQDRAHQQRQLHRAGASVFSSNAAATRHAIALVAANAEVSV